MGFTPSKTDSDMWIRDRGDHHELIATCVDDPLVWSRDVTTITKDIQDDFHLKNVGPPDCCLGGNVDSLNEHWTKENVSL